MGKEHLSLPTELKLEQECIGKNMIALFGQELNRRVQSQHLI